MLLGFRKRKFIMSQASEQNHNTVGHSIGRMLMRHGIHEFFGQALPQGLSMAFEDLGIRQVTYRTENGGGYMADGYARVCRRPGVMIAQNGPAATLVVAALAEALKSSIPLVVLLQEVPLKNEDRNAFQEFDHIRLFSACSKWTRRVHLVERVEDYVDQAFAVACSGRPGPVVLLLPNDMLGLPAAPETRTASLGHYPLDPVMPGRDVVRAVAQHLAASRNPVVMVGGGVHLSGACAAVADLQERFSLPVATTVMGKGAVDERHPLSLGVIANATGPGSASRYQRPILEEADFVLLVGTRTDQNATDSWTLYPKNAQFAHIDMDGLEVGRNYEALRVVGDARLTLEAIAEELSAMDCGPRRAARAGMEARIAEGRAKYEQQLAAMFDNSATPLHPVQIMTELQKILTPDSIVVADASFSSIWATNNLTSLRSGMRFITPRGMAGLGWGLPMAMGAAIAEPEAPIYVITGDGGFAHVWSELEVAARENLKITCIVINNGVLGYVRSSEQVRYGRNSTAITMSPMDHTLVAQACGLEGLRVHTHAELLPALHHARDSKKAVLIEVMCTPDAPPITDFVGK